MQAASDPAPPVVRLAARLAGPHAGPVRRHLDALPTVEVVEPDLVPPQAVIGDVAGWREQPSRPGLPTILLVEEDADPLEVARAVGRLAPTAVVGWPAERHGLADRLRTVAARGEGGEATRRNVARMLIAGTAGGVGVTTVALTLGGLAAWRGRTTLVVARGPVPVPGARRVAPSALAAPGLWGAATPVPGLPTLRIVAVDHAAHGSDPDGAVPIEPGGADLVLSEVGHGAEADVLVARRDAAGLDGIAASAAALAVVHDHGPAGDRALAAAVGDRRVIVVPHSIRVARAGLRGRVPGGLPGSFVRRLAPVLGRAVASGPPGRSREDARRAG